MRKINFLAGLLVVGTGAIAQINISPGNTVSQNFDGLGTSATATLPTGWKADKQTTVRTPGNYSIAGTATELRAGNLMSSSATNGIYNFGAGDPTTVTERAVGGISTGTGSQSINVYIDLVNNGTSAIPSLTISYNVEKYRNGTNAAGFRIQMYYSEDGNSWTSAGPDFLTSLPADANNNGFSTAPGVTSAVSLKTLALNINPTSHLYLAWNYSVTSGSTTTNAQALGIDDVILSAPALIPTPVSIMNVFGYKQGNVNQLRWTTVSENNNHGFEVQRSGDGINFNTIGFVNSLASNGYSNTELRYGFTDNSPAAKQFYRLLQVDRDGQKKPGSVIFIKDERASEIKIISLFPNPVKDRLNILLEIPERISITIIITDQLGRQVQNKQVNVETGSNILVVDLGRVNNGVYYIQLQGKQVYGSTLIRFLKY